MTTRMFSGRGSLVISGQVAIALAEALTAPAAAAPDLAPAAASPETAPAAVPPETAPAIIERSRIARLLHATALAAKPRLQPILRRAEARISTAVNKSDSVTHLQSEIAALRNDLASLTGKIVEIGAEQARMIEALADEVMEVRKDQAQLHADVKRMAVETTAIGTRQGRMFEALTGELTEARKDQAQLHADVTRMAVETTAIGTRQGRMFEALTGELTEARKDQAQLRAYLEVLLQRFAFPIGDGMLASRNRYGYLVLPTADLANVGYLLEGVLPEQGSLAAVERLLAPGDVFVDLGANVGLFTLAAARRVGATGRVHAIEPAPDLVAALDAQTALNQIASFVTIHPVAAGAAESSVDLYLASTSGHNSLFAEEAALPSTQVPCRPLDALIAPGTKVSVVKIDVEGAELQALAGMTRVIADNPRIVILAEFSPSIIRRAGGTPEGWIASVRAMGFNVLEIDEAAGSLSPLRAEGAGDVTSVNLLLHRPEAWSRLMPLLADAGRAA